MQLHRWSWSAGIRAGIIIVALTGLAMLSASSPRAVGRAASISGSMPSHPASTITWQPEVRVVGAGGNGDLAPALHPTDPLRALLGGPMPIRYTSDGGMSWQSGVVPVGLGQGVPSWLTGGNGQSALHVSLTPGPSGGALQFSRTTDGGAHWAGPSTLTIPNTSESLPYLWDDTNPASPRYGRLYVTVTMLDSAQTGSFDTVGLLFSTDQGSTWSAPVGLVDPTEYAQGTNYNAFASAALQPDGGVMVAWHRGQCCQTITNVPNKVMWSRSTDGGVTFPVSGTIATVPADRSVEYNSTSPGGFRWTPAPNIAADPVDGTLYAAWVAYRQSNMPFTAAVYLARSTDNGASWSAPVVVDNSQPNRYQYEPWVQVSPDHAIHVTYSAATNTVAVIAHFYAQSTDRGATWSAPFSLNVNGHINGAPQGDYETTSLGGYAGSQGTVLTAWVDENGTGTRVGTFDRSGGKTPSPTPPAPSATSIAPSPTPTCVSRPGGWHMGQPLPTAVARGAGVYFPANGKFYVMGGYTPQGIQNPRPFEYDPASNSWIVKTATFPDRQTFDMACGALEVGGAGRIICVGGSGPGGSIATDRVVSYDPVSDTITTLVGQEWPGDATGDVIPGGFAIANNKLYIVGGLQTGVGATNQVWEYDPSGPAWWTRKSDYPVAHAFIPVGVINGSLYTTGGSVYVGGTLVDSSDSYTYDPGTDTWAAISNIPRITSETRALGAGGLLWVFGGGRTAPNPSNEVDIYRPSTNAWSLGAPFASARRDIAADTDGAAMWLAGGYAPYTATNEFEIYHPPVTCATATLTTTPITSTSPTATSTSLPQAGSPTVAPTSPTMPPTATPCIITFSDVPTGNPFYAYIRCLACRGIVSGYNTTPPCAATPCFLPGNNVTRGQAAKFVANAAGYTDPIPSTQQTFTDVPHDNPFWLFIERVYLHGVIGGYNTNPPCTASPCFSPASNVTRGQAAKFVANAAGYTDPIPSTQQTFTDVPHDNPFWLFVERVYLHGVIGGYNTNPPCSMGTPCFVPGNNLTRGQMAKFIANAFYPDCDTPMRTGKSRISP